MWGLLRLAPPNKHTVSYTAIMKTLTNHNRENDSRDGKSKRKKTAYSTQHGSNDRKVEEMLRWLHSWLQDRRLSDGGLGGHHECSSSHLCWRGLQLVTKTILSCMTGSKHAVHEQRSILHSSLLPSFLIILPSWISSLLSSTLFHLLCLHDRWAAKAACTLQPTSIVLFTVTSHTTSAFYGTLDTLCSFPSASPLIFCLPLQWD